MIINWILPTIEIATIASAIVGGVFLTFSDFVMRSLNGAKAAAGIQIMQIINREVFKTVFMVLLLGMSAGSIILATYASMQITDASQLWIILGGSTYFFGVFVVSMAFNVPMNNRLDKMDYSSEEAAQYWQKIYYPRWTFWNYVRAVSSTIAAVCFLVAAIWMA